MQERVKVREKVSGKVRVCEEEYTRAKGESEGRVSVKASLIKERKVIGRVLDVDRDE